MKTRECPNCGTVNTKLARTCFKCRYSEDGGMSPLPNEVVNHIDRIEHLSPVPPQTVIVETRNTAADVISGIFWAIFCLYLLFSFANYSSGTRLDNGAPQQAARAAMSCFEVIFGYCFVRGATEALKSLFGK